MAMQSPFAAGDSQGRGGCHGPRMHSVATSTSTTLTATIAASVTAAFSASFAAVAPLLSRRTRGIERASERSDLIQTYY